VIAAPIPSGYAPIADTLPTAGVAVAMAAALCAVLKLAPACHSTEGHQTRLTRRNAAVAGIDGNDVQLLTEPSAACTLHHCRAHSPTSTADLGTQRLRVRFLSEHHTLCACEATAVDGERRRAVTVEGCRERQPTAADCIVNSRSERG